MTNRLNSLCVRCAIMLPVMLSSIAGAALADTVTLHFEIERPKDSASSVVYWGLLSNGVERARGEINFAENDATKNEAVTAAVQVDRKNLHDATSIAVLLCCNNDDLLSYVPSYGDVFQQTQLAKSGADWRVTARADRWLKKTTEKRDDALTIHYHRFDDQYTNASLWTWDEKLQRAPKQNELLPVGRDEFGIVFQLDTADYGSNDDRIGLLPRRHADWQYKDGGDRMWSPNIGQNVYILQNDNRVYRDAPNLLPTVESATLDGENLITVRFSRAVAVADWPARKFSLTASTGRAITIERVLPSSINAKRCASFSITTAEEVVFPSIRYALNIEGFYSIPITIGRIQKDPNLFYDPAATLGATYSQTKTVFQLFAPAATSAWVVVADGIEGDAVGHKMNSVGKGIWKTTIEGNLAGKFYAYKLDGEGFDSSREITDLYATCTQDRYTRSLIVDMKATDPAGFRNSDFVPHGIASNAIIYELHLRDFTIDSNSGISARGKYLGLTESDTHLSSDKSILTGLDHLIELGVTHVQIMPIQDFDNDEQSSDSYNWGYMPVHFNSPDGWYASDAMGSAKIREFKQLVKALHDRGIGVILDVVYNHAAQRSSFESIAPGYYFRMNDKGEFSNGSGCGNEFASEAPMARKFLIDSCKFWVEEYKIDGFRFDLMGLIDLDTMRELRQSLRTIHPQILVFGEPWTGGQTTMPAVTDKRLAAGTGIGAFNDHFRDAIKGDRDGHSQGFIQSGNHAEGVAAGLAGSIDDWTKNPVDSINYFAAHDNLTAWDKLLVSTFNSTDAERRRVMRFAALILFTSQGAVFMHSGQELCRSKQGSHNSYNQPDAINMIDWKRKKDYADVFEYHRGMIAIRNSHAAFRLRSAQEVRKRINIKHSPTKRCIVYRIDGNDLQGEGAIELLVLLNGESTRTQFKLPPGKWAVHADAKQASVSAIRTAAEDVSLPAHSGMLLIR